jgi:hypothetical protein
VKRALAWLRILILLIARSRHESFMKSFLRVGGWLVVGRASLEMRSRGTSIHWTLDFVHEVSSCLGVEQAQQKVFHVDDDHTQNV